VPWSMLCHPIHLKVCEPKTHPTVERTDNI
jgi:hypothetical protein